MGILSDLKNWWDPPKPPDGGLDGTNWPDFVPNITRVCHLFDAKSTPDNFQYGLFDTPEFHVFYGDFPGWDKMPADTRGLNCYGHKGLARRIVVQAFYLEKTDRKIGYKDVYQPHIAIHGEQYDFLMEETKYYGHRDWYQRDYIWDDSLRQKWYAKMKKLGIWEHFRGVLT